MSDEPRAVRSSAVLLLSGGLDSYTAGAIARARGLRALRADRSATGRCTRGRSRRRDRWRRALQVARHHRAGRAALADSADRRWSATARSQRTARSTCRGIPSTYVPARNTVFLSLAMAWAEVVRRRRDRHRRERARLFRLPRLPPGIPAAFEAAGGAGDEGRRRRRTAAGPGAAAGALQGGIIRRGLALGVDYGLTLSCYDPAARTAGPAAAATAAGCGRWVSPRPAPSTRSAFQIAKCARSTNLK